MHVRWIYLVFLILMDPSLKFTNIIVALVRTPEMLRNFLVRGLHKCAIKRDRKTHLQI